MEHTKEPWKVDERVGCVAIYERERDQNCLSIPKENFVAYWQGHRGDDGWHVRPEVSANAARIVACVNACAGIPDPAAAVERAREALVKAEDLLTFHEGSEEVVGEASEYLSIVVNADDFATILSHTREALRALTDPEKSHD